MNVISTSQVWLDEADTIYARKNGRLRAVEMAGAPDKACSVKKGELHTPAQSDALGIMAEVAACELLGYDYNDNTVYVPFAKKLNGKLPPECKQPDIAGKFEIRRIESIGNPLVVQNKDVEAGAIVIAAYVHHKDENGKVKSTSGLVTFVGWYYAVDATKRWMYWSGGAYRIPQHKLHPMSTLKAAQQPEGTV